MPDVAPVPDGGGPPQVGVGPIRQPLPMAQGPSMTVPARTTAPFPTETLPVIWTPSSTIPSRTGGLPLQHLPVRLQEIPGVAGIHP